MRINEKMDFPKKILGCKQQNTKENIINSFSRYFVLTLIDLAIMRPGGNNFGIAYKMV